MENLNFSGKRSKANCADVTSLSLVLLVGLLIPLFWTSGDICRRLQSKGGLGALSLANEGFLRFKSGVTPTSLLVVSFSSDSNFNSGSL